MARNFANADSMNHAHDSAYEVSSNDFTFCMWIKSTQGSNLVTIEHGVNIWSVQSWFGVVTRYVTQSPLFILQNLTIDAYDGTWHCITARSKGSNASRAYVDGIDDTGVDDLSDYNNVTDEFDISSRNGSIGTAEHQYNTVQWDSDIGIPQVEAIARGANPFAIDHSNMMYLYSMEGNGSDENDYGPNHIAPLVPNTGADPVPKSINPPVEMLENYL